MEKTKRTQKEMFAYIAEVNADNKEIVKFCEERIEVLNRKSSSRTQTKTQKENEVLKETIIETLTELGKAVRISELQGANEKLQFDNEGKPISNQRITALLTQLVDTKRIVRTVEKRVIYFSVVD